MLSVLIETHNHEDALARTLACLVSGAVEGVVREVIVCDAGSSDRTAIVAEHAGCHFIGEGGLDAGLRRARGDWLLLLEPGARLLDGWMDAVLEHAGEGAAPAKFRRSAQTRARLVERLFGSGRPLAQGLMITKHEAQALTKPGSAGDTLARQVKARRLDAEIAVAPVSG